MCSVLEHELNTLKHTIRTLPFIWEDKTSYTVTTERLGVRIDKRGKDRDSRKVVFD